MNWFKENPFVAALAVVTLAGAGALGYLISEAAISYSASSAAYAEAVGKLHALQEKTPFPSKENLNTIQDGLDSYSERIQQLQSQLAIMEEPLDPSVTPQLFQDKLRKAVNAIRLDADALGIKLPENFYFGFDQYQSQVPSEKAAPVLDRQLKVIQSVVSLLVPTKEGKDGQESKGGKEDNKSRLAPKVRSIDAIVRTPLPEEGAQASAPPKKQDASLLVITRFPFDISFTAEQLKFRAVFNALLGSGPFLIIRSVSIQNTSPQAPAKAAGDPVAKPANPFASAGDKGEKKSLQVILGREFVKSTLRLEMLDFAEPAARKK
ncbi:MAG: Amuc_1100 family pilus-like protein [Verrucomicrobiae bacterium]